MSVGIVFGRLKSFAGLTYNGTGSPLDPVKTGYPMELQAEFETSLLQVGHAYPYDAQGFEASPLKAQPQLTYEVHLLATTGYADDLSFQDLRRRYNLIWNAIMGTYTWGSTTGVSGAKGSLTVFDEDHSSTHTYTATARLMAPPNFQLVKAEPTHMVVMLKFGLLSPFSQDA